MMIGNASGGTGGVKSRRKISDLIITKVNLKDSYPLYMTAINKNKKIGWFENQPCTKHAFQNLKHI